MVSVGNKCNIVSFTASKNSLNQQNTYSQHSIKSLQRDTFTTSHKVSFEGTKKLPFVDFVLDAEDISDVKDVIDTGTIPERELNKARNKLAGLILKGFDHDYRYEELFTVCNGVQKYAQKALELGGKIKDAENHKLAILSKLNLTSNVKQLKDINKVIDRCLSPNNPEYSSAGVQKFEEFYWNLFPVGGGLTKLFEGQQLVVLDYFTDEGRTDLLFKAADSPKLRPEIRVQAMKALPQAARNANLSNDEIIKMTDRLEDYIPCKGDPAEVMLTADRMQLQLLDIVLERKKLEQ